MDAHQDVSVAGWLIRKSSCWKPCPARRGVGLLSHYCGGDEVRIAPFDMIAFPLSSLWAEWLPCQLTKLTKSAMNT